MIQCNHALIQWWKINTRAIVLQDVLNLIYVVCHYSRAKPVISGIQRMSYSNVALQLCLHNTVRVSVKAAKMFEPSHVIIFGRTI